jgi:hypothetical protein
VITTLGGFEDDFPRGAIAEAMAREIQRARNVNMRDLTAAVADDFAEIPLPILRARACRIAAAVIVPFKIEELCGVADSPEEARAALAWLTAADQDKFHPDYRSRLA